MSNQQTIPTEFAKAIEIAGSLYGQHFFMSGGCGVLAALLADVARAKGEDGTFYMIFRTLGSDYFIQHVCFKHEQSNDIYDIWGGNAPANLITPIVKQARMEMEQEGRREDYIEDQLPTFDFDRISIPFDTDIMETLKKMSAFYGLRVGPKWVECHYPELRDRVFEATGLLDSRRLAS